MKFVQIFLLTLIVIGVGLIVTQKWWVPKVVERILAQEAKDENMTGELCFTYKHEATTEEPYDVSEHIKIGILNNKVTGTKTGTQSGPDMTNGYEGTLEGSKIGKNLELVYSYTIEGSKNKEKEIYRIDKEALTKLRYVLKDEGDMLVPDLTSEPKELIYKQIECK